MARLTVYQFVLLILVSHGYDPRTLTGVVIDVDRRTGMTIRAKTEPSHIVNDVEIYLPNNDGKIPTGRE